MNGSQVTYVTRKDKIFYRIFISLMRKFYSFRIDTSIIGGCSQRRVEKYRNTIRGLCDCDEGEYSLS